MPAGTATATPVEQLRTLLPTGPAAQAQAVSRALGWLVDNLDRPQVVTAGCAQLGPAVAALGVPPDRLPPLGLLVGDLLRSGAVPQAPEHRAAWQATSGLVARWIAQGALAAAYEPPFWTGTVIHHDPRRQDLAVLLVRTFLPYPYLAGQHALVEPAPLPGDWRRCWLATPPTSDNVVELHVRAGPADAAGHALVGRVRPGDRLRLRPAEGSLTLGRPDGHDLLLIAEDTGVAAARALLAERRRCRDSRRTHLLWLAEPNEDPYDLAAVSAYADDTTTVTVVSTVSELAATLDETGPWSDADVYLAGTPTGVAAATTVLAYAGVPAAHVRRDEIGRDD